MHKLIKYRAPALSGKGRVFSYMMFFYAFASALLSPVFAQYLKEISGSEFHVGLLIAICSLVTLFMSGVVSKILHKISRITLLYLGFFGMATVFFAYYFVDTFHLAFLLQAVKGVIVAILFVVIPLMVRDYTDKETLAEEEGVYYWLINLAWILGPLVGGVLAYFYDIQFVFLVSMMVMLFAMAFIQHKHVSDVATNENVERENVAKNVLKFFSEPGLRKAYLVDFGLFIWWSIATVCIPLYLAFSGFPEFAIGMILAVKLLPLVFLEKWIGRNVRKGELGVNIRRGFAIMVSALFLLAFVDHVYFSIFMFVVVSVGAAFIEPIKETYLFKHLKKSEENDLFPIYSTARQLGYLVGPAVGGMIISFVGYQALFFAVGFALLPMVLVGHLIHKE